MDKLAVLRRLALHRHIYYVAEARDHFILINEMGVIPMLCRFAISL